MAADASGNYNYYAAPGCYDEVISSPGTTTQVVSGICLFGGSGGITQLTTDVLAGPSAGTVAATVVAVDHVAYPASPTTLNTVPVVTSLSPAAVTYEAIPTSALANPNTTVNTVTCPLGGTCTIPVGTLTDFAFGTLPSWLTGSVTSPTSTPVASLTASAIPNSALANSQTTIGSTAVSLGGTITDLPGLTSATVGPNSTSGDTVILPTKTVINGASQGTPVLDLNTASTYGTHIELDTGGGSPTATMVVGLDGFNQLATEGCFGFSGSNTGTRYFAVCPTGVVLGGLAVSEVTTVPATGSSCSVAGWVISANGHLGFCNGATYQAPLLGP